jgi:type VI secretion system protein ImpL
MRLAWLNLYPGPAYATARERLLVHLDALLAGPLPPVPLDGPLVTRARGSLGKVSVAQRAYSAIRLSAAAQRIAPWRPGDCLSVAGSTLFKRASGKPLNAGVAGFYTVDGFHHVLLPSLESAARDAVTESWVVGQRIDIDPKGPAMGGLEREIIGLYEADYQQTWDAMLTDLNIAPLSSVSQAAQDLFILASPQSPIRSLLVSVARQLTLSVPPGQTRRGTADIAPGSASAAQRPWAPGQEIDLRYAALRELAGSGEAAPIDQVLRSLNDMQQQFARAAATVGSGALSTGADPAMAVKVEALRQPEPLSRWLLTLAASGTALRNAESKR